MATQQPPARPWYRLATMGGRSAPVPNPTPQADPIRQPRPTFTRPALVRPVPLPPQPRQSTPAPRSPTTALASTQAPRLPTSTVAPPAIPPQSPPTIVAPTPAPRSSPTAVIRSPPRPTEQPPATPVTSSVKTYGIVQTSPLSLSPVTSAQKSSPTPQAPPSNSIQQSPNQKFSVPYSSLQNPTTSKQVSPVSAPPPSPYQMAPTAVSAHATPSSKFNNSQPNSPSASQIRPNFHPPSPLTLPPAQLKSDSEHETKIPQEVQQKYVIVQETKEKPRVSNKNSNSDQLLQHNGNTYKNANPHNGNREGNDMEHVSHKDLGMSVLTIAGENNGAIMELCPRTKNEYGNNHHKNGIARNGGEGYKSGSDSSSSEEWQSKIKDKKHNVTAPPETAYMNSNVQGVNNSVLYNVSYTHHDPGVRFSFSGKANGSGRSS